MSGFLGHSSTEGLSRDFTTLYQYRLFSEYHLFIRPNKHFGLHRLTRPLISLAHISASFR
jgi:hypothetical protein